MHRMYIQHLSLFIFISYVILCRFIPIFIYLVIIVMLYST